MAMTVHTVQKNKQEDKKGVLKTLQLKRVN